MKCKHVYKAFKFVDRIIYQCNCGAYLSNKIIKRNKLPKEIKPNKEGKLVIPWIVHVKLSFINKKPLWG